MRDRVVPLTVQGAPGTVRITSGDRRATVSFTAPGNTGGATISGYQYSVDGGRSWHRLVTSTTGSRLTGVVSALRNGTTYQVTLRAVNAAGTGEASDAVAAKPVAPTSSRRWFKDPLTSAQRAHLARIPANPKNVHGRLRMTRALHQTHSGRLAVPAGTARGHQLTRGQAVELERLFRFDSASLSASGRHTLRVLATSMRSEHALTCEGFTDYSGTRRHHQMLSRARGITVCHVLQRYTGSCPPGP